MNRIIKFRGKRKLNGKWAYGSYVHAGNDWCHIIPLGTELEDWEMERYRVITDTVGQFTGLTDKNGKEIYEGDIGEIKSQSGRIERFTVEWGIQRREMKSGWIVDIPGFAFMIDGRPTFPIAKNYLNGHDLDLIEVVGNIYENPELLKP